MLSTTCLVGVFVVGCLSAPIDDPIRVDLPVYDQPQLGSDVYLAHALELENHGQLRNDHSIIGNILSQNVNAAMGALGHTSNVQAGSLNHQGAGGWFSPPVTTLEGALLETEGLGSKSLSIKDNLHGIVSGILQPKPIVDTINEEDKYGNNGDKFYSAGRAVVHGAEGVSNLVNSLIEIPGSILRKITKAASEKLNNLGGKLIGL